MRNGNKSMFSGDLTGGSLLVRESRIAARLLLDINDPDQAVQRIISENLFQNHSRATSVKYCRLIFKRFLELTEGQRKIVATGADSSARLMLLAAVLKTYPLVCEFFRHPLTEKFRCNDLEIDKSDWIRFLEQRETIDPDLTCWTDSTRQKIGQVILRMLFEAGYIASTRRPILQPLPIPEDVVGSLREAGDHKVIQCLTFGKGLYREP